MPMYIDPEELRARLEKAKQKESLPEALPAAPAPPPAVTTQPLTLSLESLEAELTALRKERAKISSSLAPTVERIRADLNQQNPALAANFINGHQPMNELKDLWAQIERYQQQITALYDKCEHIRNYGAVPQEVPTVIANIRQTPEKIMALRQQLRRLDDLIYKNTKKLKEQPNAKADKKLDWLEKKALAEAQREEVKATIKRLEYEARRAASGG